MQTYGRERSRPPHHFHRRRYPGCIRTIPRSGRLEKVLEGARNIVKWKKELKSKTPFVFFQFLVVRPNEHQLEDIRRLATEVGVDEVRFKTARSMTMRTTPMASSP